MKHFLLLILLALLPMLASADSVLINGIYYNLIPKAKQAEVTSNPNKYSGKIVIPEKVTYEGVEYSVTSFNSAFSRCPGLTSITIPNSVTSIVYAAFEDCTGLTSVTIGNGVKSIGGRAFYYCFSLTSVTIGNSVTNVDSNAFDGCSSLTSVHISDISAWCNINFNSNPLSYAHHLYLNGEEVKDLVIPNSVTSIGKGAFAGCAGLTSVTIPNSVTNIGDGAFSGCTGLTSIIIPNSVTSIKGAFSGCTGLTSITIPNSVTSIGGGAFSGCTGLTSITIPNSVTSIGNDAFLNCSGLTSITIPNSVTSIGNDAFFNCSGLTSITIGNGIKTIYQYAFSYCKELVDVYCYAENVPAMRDYQNKPCTNAFENSLVEYATLHVPASAYEAYRTTEPWSSFGTFKTLEGNTPETKKCATPCISYGNKKLTFDSDTEGVEFVSEIKVADNGKFYDDRITLNATYEISVYATKAGYENSDVATATLVWSNASFTETTPATAIAPAAEMEAPVPVLIQNNGGTLTIQGAQDGTPISVYTIAGIQAGTAVSQNGRATISTNMQQGDIAIVKIGERSVKVVMK